MKIFILAGEASGDRLGAALMQGLQKAVPVVEFQGVAGPETVSYTHLTLPTTPYV